MDFGCVVTCKQKGAIWTELYTLLEASVSRQGRVWYDQISQSEKSL